MDYFKNRKILITGGSSGIGKALAILFVKLEASVCILSRDKKKLELALTEILNERSNNEQVITYIALDVSLQSEMERCKEEVIEKLGGLHFIINSAGISIPGYIEELPYESFEEQFRINYFGTVNICKTFFSNLENQKYGHIVNISSSAGFIGLFGYSAYSASKFAIVGFSEGLRQELLTNNINVSVVFPPDTDTPMLKNELGLRPYETNKLCESVKVLSPEKVALSIIKGIHKKKRYIIPGFDNKLFYLFNRFFPNLLKLYMDSIIKRYSNKKI